MRLSALTFKLPPAANLDPAKRGRGIGCGDFYPLRFPAQLLLVAFRLVKLGLSGTGAHTHSNAVTMIRQPEPKREVWP